jgi:5'-3' exonuclease
MGIPSYFSYIIKNHSNIIRNLQYHRKHAKTIFHSLYMDCNSIIYDIVHSIEKNPNRPPYSAAHFEKHVIDMVISRIREYIQVISPTMVLFIAFDGVAPLAKMDQQRARRYKTAFMSSLSFDHPTQPFSVNNAAAGSSAEKWNTTAITPGTKFMEMLSQRVHAEFSSKNVVANGFVIPRVIVSTSTEAGEGEHKMFAYMRKHVKPHENVAVYGLDSDLIMLSILHSVFCRNVFIFRETPQFSKTILPVHLRNDSNELLFLDIRFLAKSILGEMKCVEYDTQRIYDYILMSVLLGNDFLPHMVSLNLRGTGMEELLETYAEHITKRREYLVSATREINWKNVKTLIGKLAAAEHTNIVDEYKQRVKISKRKYPENTPEDRELLLQKTPIIYRGEEDYICPTEEEWETRYYRMCFGGSDATPDTKRDICVNYAEGLEWVFRYYSEGCPHWRWKYRFHYPPLLTDLYRFLPNTNGSLIDKITCKNAPFLPIVQLSYVVPPISHSLLPEKTRELLQQKYPEYFVDIRNIRFSWMFCKYFWESRVLLPDIPMAVLNEWECLYSPEPRNSRRHTPELVNRFVSRRPPPTIA